MPANLGCGIAVVYVDASIIVINKPSGLLAVPGRGPDKEDCVSRRVQQQYPDALVVHRLDMSTSGLMVMARGVAAQRTLSQAFAQRQVQKRYVAVVGGECMTPQDTWQVIDLPIGVDWPNRPRRVIDLRNGQASITRLRSTSFDAHHQTTRLELEPLTGRTHQLRVHLQAIHHPIAGDALYAPPAVLALSARLLLHASVLSFPHPQSGAPMAFECVADF